MNCVFIWFVIGLVFLGIELVSFGLISIWFSIGAFVTMLFTDLSIYNQFYIFTGISLISLLLVRKIAMKYLKGKSKEVNRIKKAEVEIKEIKENGNYTVYSEGKYWDCISDEKLEVGERVYVEKIEGNKLVLKKIKRKK